jgi:hypothetical protein
MSLRNIELGNTYPADRFSGEKRPKRAGSAEIRRYRKGLRFGDLRILSPDSHVVARKQTRRI